MKRARTKGKTKTVLRRAGSQSRLEFGLRVIIELTDGLIKCPTTDAIFKLAVEGARERLGIERCAILVNEDKMIRGTFGTDRHGRTSDERQLRFPADEGWLLQFRQKEARSLWSTLDEVLQYDFDGRDSRIIGRGWVAFTPIAQRGQDPIAVFCNDTAITHSPCDSVQQDLIAVFCSLLATAVQRKKTEAAIRESEHKFRSLCETTRASIFLFQGPTLAYVNPAAEEITGYSAQELTTMNFWDIIHPDFRELVRSRGTARLRGESVPPRYEVKILNKDGQERWMDYNSSIVEIEGQPAVLGMALDITQRMRAEEQLRDILESERLMVRIATDLSQLVAGELSARLRLALSRIARRLRAQVGTLFLFSDDATSITQIFESHKRGVPSGRRFMENVPLTELAFSAGVVKSGEVLCVSNMSELPSHAKYERKIASYMGLQSLLLVPVFRRGRVSGALGIGRTQKGRAWMPEEISFAKLAGEIVSGACYRHELEEEHERLANKLLALQEEERKNISGTLHDDLGQLLTLTSVELDGLKTGNGASQRVLRRAIDRIGTVLASVRNLAVSLRPPILDDLGVATGLKMLCREYNRRGRMRVHWRMTAKRMSVGDDGATCLYRVLQEALTNATRHASARHVYVKFGAQNGSAILDIRDDGQGFNVDAQSRRRGIGLIGMKERLRQCGGEVEISSLPGAGTHIIATLPRKSKRVGRNLRKNQ